MSYCLTSYYVATRSCLPLGTYANLPPLSLLQTGSFSLPPEDSDPLPTATEDDIPDSLSQLGPLRLSPEPRAARAPRSAIGALLDPAADESMDDLMSLCSGKFDGECRPRGACQPCVRACCAIMLSDVLAIGLRM